MSIDAATLSLTQKTACDLARLIAAGEVSSVEVVDAHIARIEQVNPRLNALVQPMFESAREGAQAADARQAAGEPLGPMHGVPVTIKDCFAVPGGETTLGIPGYSTGPASYTAPLVARLQAAGAIVLGKTNVPQAMLTHECNNPLFGSTLHPDDDQRSPGGSTGGEPALVAMGASPLGLGSDLGGSIRQPAAACGVVGFKPSTGRLTLAGSQRALSRGMQAIAIQPGPLARNVADVDLAMRVLTDPKLASRQPDERYDEWPDYRQVDASRLRIACWADDGVFRPPVGLRRGVELAVERLRQEGAEVVSLSADKQPPFDSREMMQIYLGLISADGMASVRRLVRGGPIEPQLARQIRLARAPRWLRGPLAGIAHLARQPDIANLLRWTGARSASDYWNLTIAAGEFRQRFWQSLEQQCGGPIDAVLSLPYGLPALRHGTALHLLMAASHSFLANLLDAPAGVVSVGRVSPDDEQQELAAGTGSWNLTSRFARQNAEGSTGLPLAVQLMARAGQDDTALAAMACVEREA